MIVKIQDTGSFDTEKYGNGLTLTKGLRLYHRNGDGSLVAELTAKPILTNSDWSVHCYDVQVLAFGKGDEVLAIRWTFDKTGEPVKLDGDKGDYLEMVLNDNFTGLNEHYFCVQGHTNG